MTIRTQHGLGKISFLAFSSLAALAMASAASAAETGQPAGDPAQPAAGVAAADTADSGTDIVVTGTRVVRDGFQSPTPLTVLTKDDINNTSPTNNIADFVNQLPQLAGSTKPANSRLNI